MKKILRDIKSGAFVKEWMEEYKDGLPVLKAAREREEAHLINKVGKTLRKMMTWLGKD